MTPIRKKEEGRRKREKRKYRENQRFYPLIHLIICVSCVNSVAVKLTK